MEKFRQLIIVQTLHVHLFFSLSLVFQYFSAVCLYFTTVAELSLRINFSNYITCAGKDKTHELGFAILSTFNYSFCLFGVRELCLQVAVISACNDMTMCSELIELNADF